MVPRDQFNRMAVLALVAIILLLTFACRAYAAEVSFVDSGPAPDEGAVGSILEELARIRIMQELVICVLVPFAIAAYLVYKFCMWFYYTFVRSVL